MDYEPPPVQVAKEPDQARLIGFKANQRGFQIDPLDGYVHWAFGVWIVLLNLALYLDLVSTDIVHALWLLCGLFIQLASSYLHVYRNGSHEDVNC